MAIETFSLTATDGHALHAQSWTPDTEPVGVLVIIHGFYEHLGRYEHVAKAFTEANWAVYALDQRGHGQTKGKRGHAKFPQVLEDVEVLLMRARADFNSQPMVILGHSWGGCIVSNFLLRKPTHELAGAILSSAWLRLQLVPPRGKEILGNVMAKIFPSLTVPNELEEGSLSKDPAVEKAYKEDPLVHNKISAGIFKETTDAGVYAIANAHRLSVPTLVMHGDADPVIAFSGSEDFVKGAGEMATFHPWPGLRHEPHNEPDQGEVIARMLVFAQQFLK